MSAFASIDVKGILVRVLSNLILACSGGTTAGLALAAHLSKLETKVCLSHTLVSFSSADMKEVEL